MSDILLQRPSTDSQQLPALPWILLNKKPFNTLPDTDSDIRWRPGHKNGHYQCQRD